MVSTDTPCSNVDLGAVESWVRLIHGESPGFVHICSTLSWSGSVFQVANDMEGIKAYVQRLHDAGAKGIYMRATTVARPMQRGERGSIEDSVTLPGFWGDIDIAGPGHKTNNPLPVDEDVARAIVTHSRLPEPTLWVHSGGGLYPWWLLDQPLPLNTPERVAAAQALSNRWQECLVHSARELGLSYGSVGDLARVLRLPGTLNRKTDTWKQCQIIDDQGDRLTLDDVKWYLTIAEEFWTPTSPDRESAQTTKSVPQQRSSGDASERPGDHFNATVDWDWVMGQEGGYHLLKTVGEESFWVRPGKNPRDGHSCTTNYRNSNYLYVFSTEMDGFQADRSYTKFAAWTMLKHGGDFTEAARDWLRRNPQLKRASPLGPPPPLTQQGQAEAGSEQVVTYAVESHFDHSETGNAERMVRAQGNRFRRVAALKQWYAWDGKSWVLDELALVNQAAKATLEEILVQAEDLMARDEDHLKVASNPAKLKKCQCQGCATKKWYTASRSRSKLEGMIDLFGKEPGVAASIDQFDARRDLVTVGNGILNPETRELLPFDPKYMLTKRLHAEYRKDATAPKFQKFIESVLPNPVLRDYIQRALGYTLLGENDQRAMFIIEGKSGTGKSQFLNIFTRVFGDFGATAASTAFRETRNESTYELHALRGRRFVTTSETSDTSKMDEELLKRLTGRDDVTTRNLFQPPVTWTPGFTIWMATNFAPRMNADDSAIWDRCKYIKFERQFVGEERIPDLGNKIAAEEASGILNWLLDGVAAYRERGLMDPVEIVEAVEAQRLESDSVAQFILDGTEGDLLVADGEAEVRCSVLYKVYVEWCLKEHIPRLGQRRFVHRMKGLGYEQFKSSVMHWRGLRLNGQTGFLGTMG